MQNIGFNAHSSMVNFLYDMSFDEIDFHDIKHKNISDIKRKKTNKKKNKIDMNKKCFIETFKSSIKKYDGFLGLPNYVVEDIIQYVSDVAYGTKIAKYHNHYYNFKSDKLNNVFNDKIKKDSDITLTISAVSSKIIPSNDIMSDNLNEYDNLVLTISSLGKILRSCLIIDKKFNIQRKSAIFIYFDSSLNVVDDNFKYMEKIGNKIHDIDFKPNDIPFNDVMMLLKIKFNLNEEIKEIIPEIYYDGAYNFNSSDFNQRLDLIDLILY
jgi:hypothetical protein